MRPIWCRLSKVIYFSANWKQSPLKESVLSTIRLGCWHWGWIPNRRHLQTVRYFSIFFPFLIPAFLLPGLDSWSPLAVTYPTRWKIEVRRGQSWQGWLCIEVAWVIFGTHKARSNWEITQTRLVSTGYKQNDCNFCRCRVFFNLKIVERANKANLSLSTKSSESRKVGPSKKGENKLWSRNLVKQRKPQKWLRNLTQLTLQSSLGYPGEQMAPGFLRLWSFGKRTDSTNNKLSLYSSKQLINGRKTKLIFYPCGYFEWVPWCRQMVAIGSCKKNLRHPTYRHNCSTNYFEYHKELLLTH